VFLAIGAPANGTDGLSRTAEHELFELLPAVLALEFVYGHKREPRKKAVGNDFAARLRVFDWQKMVVADATAVILSS
jgi:hypothetical protein